jgi:methylated-DNA-protein-cysteine methyltransferase-like protein
MGMFEDIYAAVCSIEKGRVASYGFVSRLSGHKGAARQVGWALHQNPKPGVIPCHRVVKIDGSLSPAFAFGGENMQRKLLENEGVEFVDGKVDMRRFALDLSHNLT